MPLKQLARQWLLMALSEFRSSPCPSRVWRCLPLQRFLLEQRGQFCHSLGELAAMPRPSQPRACLHPRAGYNHLDVAEEEDEQCSSSLSLFIFAALSVMTSRDELDQQHVFPGGFVFKYTPIFL